MPDFAIESLRGGMNDTDPAISLSDDQAVLCQNVELTKSTMGERRQGTTAVTLTGSGITAADGFDRVTFLHRHVPGTDETAAELWALAADGTTTLKLARKTTSWTNPAIADTEATTIAAQMAWRGVSFRGKLFLAYDSDVDRLHVWDGSSIRRVGLAEPAAPTSADQGSGTFTGTRYYRVRYTEQVASVTVRRSEPSDVLTDTPSGTGSAIRVTKPAAISEGETHWELEASVDNANFYVIATTVVGTTTVDDSQDYATGYAQSFTLSEDIGDYSLPWSAKYLAVDEDRLVIAGSFESSALSTRVGWTPVFQDPGDGNDERIPLDTDNYNDLNGLEGGEITGLSNSVNGSIYLFKYQQVYKMVRTGLRARAYDIFCLTKARGALDGSVVEGVDAAGNPCVYFLDPKIGPCRAGMGGVKSCGKDIMTTWQTVNLGATTVVCRGIFYPEKRQVIWTFATGSSNAPDKALVLQTDLTVDTKDEGIRRGWAVWTGTRAQALAMCLFSTNIDAGVARNRILKPFIGLESSTLIHISDTGDDDNGTEYSARIVSKPYAPAGILNHSKVLAGALLAKAATGASVDVKAHRDFGLETLTVSGVSFTPTASETEVIKMLDNFTFSELRTFQVEFVDVSTPGPRWELSQFAMKLTGGQKA